MLNIPIPMDYTLLKGTSLKVSQMVDSKIDEPDAMSQEGRGQFFAWTSDVSGALSSVSSSAASGTVFAIIIMAVRKARQSAKCHNLESDHLPIGYNNPPPPSKMLAKYTIAALHCIICHKEGCQQCA